MEITQKSVWHIVTVQYMFTVISINLRSTITILENSLRSHHWPLCHSPQIFNSSHPSLQHLMQLSPPFLLSSFGCPCLTQQRAFSLHLLENTHAVSSSLPLTVCVSHISVLLGSASSTFGSQTDRFRLSYVFILM